MKNIAYILASYPCPSETFIQREIKQLMKQGFSITIFASKVDSDLIMPDDHPTTYPRPCFFSLTGIWAIVFIIISHPLRLVKLMFLLIKLSAVCPQEALTVLRHVPTICYFAKTAEQRRIQHIHACFLSWPGSIGLGVSLLTGLPFSIAAHARDIYVEGGAVGFKVRRASFISCCTRQGLDYLHDKMGCTCRDKLFLNYHGIDLVRKTPLPVQQKIYPPKYIIAVGRLVEKKGFHYLVEAFGRIKEHHPNVSLVIVGDGPQKIRLRSLIKRIGLHRRVFLADWLEHGRVLKLIQRAGLLIVPSIIDDEGDRDGIPNVILEAFSVDTPVVASHLAGISEAVIDNVNGLLVRPGDTVQLAKIIEKLLFDDTLSTRVIKNAKKMLTDHFDIKKNCIQLAKAFERNGCPENGHIKIVHVVEGFVGGVSTYLCHVLSALKQQGFDITLIYSPGRCDAETPEKIHRLVDQGIAVYTVPMTRAINPLMDIYCLFRLIRIFVTEKFDIVHTHCSKAGVLGRLAARLAGNRILYYSSHCFAFLRCGRYLSHYLYRYVEKLLSGMTTNYIAVSDGDADSAIQWSIFSKEKSIIIKNGLPIDTYNPKRLGRNFSIKTLFHLPSGSHIVATACRLVSYKGLFTFIEAAGYSTASAIFVIAGEGPLRKKLKRYIVRNGLSKKIILLGYVSDMDRLYTRCELFVLCSMQEAQPYVVLEAMRAKCPVIASDVPGNRELLTDDRGMLVEPEPRCIAQAIDDLLKNDSKRSMLVNNAYTYVCAKHRLEDQVDKLARLYRDNPGQKEQMYHFTDAEPTPFASAGA